jgi:hypothetical protein
MRGLRETERKRDRQKQREFMASSTERVIIGTGFRNVKYKSREQRRM